MSSILNLAAYRFVPLEDLPAWRVQIAERARQESLRGTVLLSEEGINLFVAGPADSTRRWFDWLTGHAPFAELSAKPSWSAEQPFNRMLVRLKREIISFGVAGIDPAVATSPRLSPDQLKQWLDAGKPVTLLDVRNDYEVAVGTFSGAQAIGIDHFRDFPAAAERLPETLKRQPVVTFCTGGIRCEKAGPYLQQAGFKDVYQLDGGILAYFQQHGDRHFEGDCFVFDKRVALNGQLRPSGLAQCFACQAILTVDEQRSAAYRPGESCPRCRPADSSSPEDAVREAMRALITRRQAAIAAATRVLPGSVAHDNIRPLNIPQRFDGQTLFECVLQMHPHLGEAYWAAEFAAGRILRGRQPVGGDRPVRAGQRFGHLFPNTVEPAVNGEIEFIWECDALVVVNKPAPLPVHPSGRFHHNTLVGLLSRVFGPEQPLRPVHRLDANTTGLVVLAKSRATATDLQRQFASGLVTKHYLAECQGWPKVDRFVCDEPISRQRGQAGARGLADPRINGSDRERSQPDAADSEVALTEVEVMGRHRDRSGQPRALLRIRPRTGRTNQIRVHLWGRELPLVGDPLYRPAGQLGEVQTLDVDSEPLRLHAWRLELDAPGTGRRQHFVATAPDWAFSSDPGPNPSCLIARDR